MESSLFFVKNAGFKEINFHIFHHFDNGQVHLNWKICDHVCCNCNTKHWWWCHLFFGWGLFHLGYRVAGNQHVFHDPRTFPCPWPVADHLSVLNWPEILTNKSYVSASVTVYSYLPTYSLLCNYFISSSYLAVSARFNKNTALKVSVPDLTSSPVDSLFYF